MPIETFVCLWRFRTECSYRRSFKSKKKLISKMINAISIVAFPFDIISLPIEKFDIIFYLVLFWKFLFLFWFWWNFLSTIHIIIISTNKNIISKQTLPVRSVCTFGVSLYLEFDNKFRWRKSSSQSIESRG